MYKAYYTIDREICEALGSEHPLSQITPPLTWEHPNVTIDDRLIYCKDCDVVLWYYNDLTEELLSSHQCQDFVIKPHISGVKKTLEDLCLYIPPSKIIQIENDLKEVTEGKVKKGKPRHSILAICYIVAMPKKLNMFLDLLEVFKITQQSFIVGLRAYESKFGSVDLTHMEVPKELSN